MQTSLVKKERMDKLDQGETKNGREELSSPGEMEIDMICYSRRRFRKGKGKRRSSFFSQLTLRFQNSEEGNTSADERAQSKSSQLPDTYTLEYILDELQRNDKEELFGQPVDSNVVFHYYDIIKEPIDFGTIRAKVQEGKYQMLEQFEREVMLVAQNAMKYNSAADMFFRQARSINECAKRLFRQLHDNPSVFSQQKKRPSRKLAPTVSSSCSVPRKRNINSNTPREEDISGEESCDRRRVLLGEKEEIASLLYRSSKQFELVDTSIGYRESLQRFAKDLGPTAQRIVAEKLNTPCLSQATAGSLQAPTAFSLNSLRYPDVFKGKNVVDYSSSGGNSVAAGADRLNIGSCFRENTASTGNAYIAALTEAARIRRSANVLHGVIGNKFPYPGQNQNQLVLQQQYQLPNNAAIINAPNIYPGYHVPVASVIRPGTLGAVSGNQNLPSQQMVHPWTIFSPSRFSRTCPASGNGVWAGQQSTRFSLVEQLQNRLGLEAHLQQQMAPAQQPLPLLNQMFGEGTGPSSSAQNHQDNVAWNRGQQQPLGSTTHLNLELQLRSKPPSPDEGS